MAAVGSGTSSASGVTTAGADVAEAEEAEGGAGAAGGAGAFLRMETLKGDALPETARRLLGGSSDAPERFREGSGKVQGRFREGSIGGGLLGGSSDAPVCRTETSVSSSLREGSGKVQGRFREGSGKVQGSTCLPH
jgi:hypothetical protein